MRTKEVSGVTGMYRAFGWSFILLPGLWLSWAAYPPLLQAEPAANASASPDHPVACATALGLAELEQLALQRNPTLAQAAAAIASSKGKALQAGLYPNPTIGYQGDQMGAQGTAGELQGGYVQQTIITAGKLRLSRAKYNQEVCEAEIQALAQQLRVLNGVRLRFYEILAVQRMVEIRSRLLQNAEESLRTYREMHNAGQANRADVLLAEVEAQRARIHLHAEENRYRASWENLIAVLGAPELPLTPLLGQLEADCPPLEWESSLAHLLQDSPELQFAQAHVVHDQITVQREKVEPIPNVNLQAYTGRNFETLNTVAGVVVGVEVPLWNRNQGSIKQAQADLARSHAEVSRVELSLRRRLANVFETYLTAWETARVCREINIPKAQEAYDVQKEMYEKRRVAWPEVVKLQRNLYLIQSEYTHSLLEFRKAEIQIQGLLLVDGLTEPPGPVPGGHLEATPQPR
jgi:cobalt-zinc-cadmium efflux system outer membrane protein